VLAVGCIALVIALGLFAASPLLHQQLHHHSGADDDGCAVVLFATGVSVPLDLPALLPPSTESHAQPYVAFSELFLDSPGYLQPRGRGPPVA
jgi:hypothetical protein